MGRMAKDLIDHGRADFLSQHGFDDVGLHTYCDAALTPENVLIVATDRREEGGAVVCEV